MKNTRDLAIDNVLKDLGFDSFDSREVMQAPLADKQETSTFQPGPRVPNHININKMSHPSIQMGAQGFRDSDWSPATTDNIQFPDLKSEKDVAVQSEYAGNKLGSRGSFGVPNDIAMNNMMKNFQIESILDPTGQNEKSQYFLTLRIQFVTKPGESMSVIGEIDELGNWQRHSTMRWTNGHIWVLDVMVASKHTFSYKYVLMKDDKPFEYEKGANRLADLKILKDMAANDSALVSVNNNMYGQIYDPDHKHVEINDIWEQFQVKFSIYYPVENEFDQGLYISGSLKELGRDSQPIKMQRKPPQSTSGSNQWLYNKYGQEVRPWEHTITLNNIENQLIKDQQPVEFTYQYYLINQRYDKQVQDKMKKIRKIQVQSNESYKGQSAARFGSFNSNKVWIVNGVANKIDGNFIPAKFAFNEIGQTGISIGPYPEYEIDYETLHKEGIKVIINLMTDDEIEYRQIKLEQVQHYCYKLQIKFVRIPLNDYEDDQYSFDLISAAKELCKNSKSKVYLHCASGVSRAPTLALVYMCLFKKIDQWQNAFSSLNYLQSYCKETAPNMKMVQKVIEKNQAFQKKQKAGFKSADEYSGGSSTPKPRDSIVTLPDRTEQPKHLEYDTSFAIDQKYISNLKDGLASESVTQRSQEAQQHQNNQASIISDSIPEGEMNQLLQLRPKEQSVKIELFDQSLQEYKAFESQNEMNHLLENNQNIELAQRETIVTRNSQEVQPVSDGDQECEQLKSTSFQKGALTQSNDQPNIVSAEPWQRRNDAQLGQASGKPSERTEIMVKQIEEKIRKEMEENLKNQQLEAERMLQEREEQQIQELEQLKSQVLQEQEENKRQKELKKKKKEQQASSQQVEKQNLLNEVANKLKEVENLKEMLAKEAKERERQQKQIEKESKSAKIKVEVQKTKEQKHKEEIEYLKVKKLQMALKEANEKKKQYKLENRRKKQERIEQQQRERELEEAEAIRVANEKKRKIKEEPQITNIKQMKVMKYDEDHDCDKTVAFIEEQRIVQEFEIQRTEIKLSHQPEQVRRSKELRSSRNSNQMEFLPQRYGNAGQTESLLKSSVPKDSIPKEKQSVVTSETHNLDESQSMTEQSDTGFLQELAKITQIANEKREAKYAQVLKDQQAAEDKILRDKQEFAIRKASQEEEQKQKQLEAQEHAKQLAREQEEARRQQEQATRKAEEMKRKEELSNKDKMIEQLQNQLKKQMEDKIRETFLQEQKELLAKQQAIQKQQDEFEAAIVEITGVLIIDAVESEITQIYNELVEEERQKQLYEEQQAQLLQEKEQRENAIKFESQLGETKQEIATIEFSQNITNVEEKKFDPLTKSFEIRRQDQDYDQSINETITNLLGTRNYSPNVTNTTFKKSPRTGISAYQKSGALPAIKDRYNTSPSRQYDIHQRKMMAVGHSNSQLSQVQSVGSGGANGTLQRNGTMYNASSHIYDFSKYSVDNLNTLFLGKPPIAFKPKRGNVLDQHIANLINCHQFKIPIANIHGALYLIGTNRCNCDLKFSTVFVKGAGGGQKLEDYIKKNEEAMKFTLIDQMVKTNSDLEVVVDSIMKGKKVALVRNQQNQNKAKGMKTTRNSSGFRSDFSPKSKRNTSQTKFSTSRAKISPTSNRWSTLPTHLKKSSAMKKSPSPNRFQQRNSNSPGRLNTSRQPATGRLPAGRSPTRLPASGSPTRPAFGRSGSPYRVLKSQALPSTTLGYRQGPYQTDSPQRKPNRFERQPSPKSPRQSKVVDPLKAYTTRTVKTYMSPSRKTASPQQAKAAGGQIVPFPKAVIYKGKARGVARKSINNDLINSKDM